MKMEKTSSRRTFIRQLSSFAAASTLSSLMPAQVTDETANSVSEHVILFQGDSITDGNRSRNKDWNHVMGHGYQFIIASKLWYELPGKGLHFFNRGISGNKITDLATRWDEDTIALKPDVLSILIGINDTEAFLRGDQNFSADYYQKNYDALLQKTMEELPGVRLIVGEPFVLPTGRVKEKLSVYENEIKMRRQIVKELAGKYKAILIPYQQAFNKALQRAPAEYWIWDGIHPMPAGHELMAREWLKHVKPRINFLR